MLIAEIGVNHNGDMKLAKEMIDAAKESGADAVKFQTFKAETLVSQGTPKVKYQENTTSPQESHFEMIKCLELSRDDHFIIKEGQWHQITNPFDKDCHLIELQYGNSVIEEDIERLSFYQEKKT